MRMAVMMTSLKAACVYWHNVWSWVDVQKNKLTWLCVETKASLAMRNSLGNVAKGAHE